MKVFITTSGIGSRLGKLTEFTNKSMVKIGQKPAISYIIEQYPKDFEFVITLGYFGDHVKQFLEMAYPERKFTFVCVDRYEGPGTSQVYSQLCAKDYLQEPFIYNDCDTIVKNLESQVPLRDFDYNFMVGFKTLSELYDSFDYDATSKKGNYESYKITRMYRKAESTEAMLSYIGIAGVYDYKTFWDTFERAYREIDYKILNDIYVYNHYNMFDDLRAIIVDNWTDTGSISGVMKARETFEDRLDVLNKNNEAIFVVNNKVIKFFANEEMLNQIMTHYDFIKEFCPKIIDRTRNFFSYPFIPGKTLMKEIDSEKFECMLEYYMKAGLWDDAKDCKNDFKECQHRFWIERCKERVKKFKDLYGVTEGHDIVVNGLTIPTKYTVDYMLSKLEDMFPYKNSKWTNWHGDFTLENIIEGDDNNLYLIDLRQNYDKELQYGDKLYDWGKLNMNLMFNYESIYNNLYTVKGDESNIHVDIKVSNNAYECKSVLKKFVNQHLCDYDYIEFVSSIILIDLCPLFADPLPKFLYYLGKYKMYKALRKIEQKYKEDIALMR